MDESTFGQAHPIDAGALRRRSSVQMRRPLRYAVTDRVGIGYALLIIVRVKKLAM